MAVLYPERLPQSILDDPKRSAERRVYECLASLDDRHIVYYSVGWQSRDARHGVQDGEADFVIAHPKHGVLVLEVKGGRIAYNSRLDQWFSTDRAGVEHPLTKDPVEQALRSEKELLGKFQSMPGWGRDWLTMGHVVVFPDVEYGRYPLRPDLPPEIVISANHLADLPSRIADIFQYYNAHGSRTGELGYGRLEIVDQLLARSFELKTPLGAELRAEEARLVELTEQQMAVLGMLAHHRRVAIEGCAGSGKTMLAVRKTQHLADQGFRVLLTCFNAALSSYLAACTDERVAVFNFHGLCRHYIDEYGVSLRPIVEDREFYDVQMPDMLLEVIDEIGPQFDAVIVDEGQDFRENWWLPLSMLLEDQANGIFYVFFDNNQNLYRGMKMIPGVVDTLPFQLSVNCRNTTRIHNVVARYHDNPTSLKSLGPEGRPPRWREYADQADLERTLSKTLHHYLEDEGVTVQEIVVLTPHSKEKTTFTHEKKIGKYTLVHREPRHELEVRLSSIHAFKGLESQVVILAELDRLTDNLGEVLYVGASRAKTELVFLAEKAFAPTIKNHIETLIAES